MKSTYTYIMIGILAFLALIVLSSGLYTVWMTEQVIITRFGKPVGEVVDDPGLHWKRPFVEKANRFEKRILEWDGDPNQIPSLDKKYIWVYTGAWWFNKNNMPNPNVDPMPYIL
ncbi:hypothetical protein LCGC14_1613570, partial [marine sediment metagenome]